MDRRATRARDPRADALTARAPRPRASTTRVPGRRAPHAAARSVTVSRSPSEWPSSCSHQHRPGTALAVQGDGCHVPQMAGLAEADAVAALTAAGITPGARTTAYDGVVPAGIVISSDPPAGTVIETDRHAPSTTSSAWARHRRRCSRPRLPPRSRPNRPQPPKPKPTPWPTPPGIKGLDVSHWNGAPNFGTLRNSGMEFVFSKASQGTSMQDETFLRNTSEARAAGLVAGAYHFFDYTKAGKPQARHFLATVGNATGFDGLLPLVVDVETLKSLGTPDQAKARARLHALLDELYRQTGRYPMIYTSRTMWDRVVGGPEEFGPYPLWVACWKCDNIHLPAGLERLALLAGRPVPVP